MQKILKITVLVLLLLIGVPLAATLFISYRFSDSDCGRLIAIAQDDAKARYLEDWADDAIVRQSFRRYMEPEYRSAQDDPDFFEEIDLDWDLLGLDRDTASVTLVRPSGGTPSGPASNAAAQVGIGSGPELIVVEGDGTMDLTQANPDNSAGLYKQKFTTAGRRLVVYCRQDPR